MNKSIFSFFIPIFLFTLFYAPKTFAQEQLRLIAIAQPNGGEQLWKFFYQGNRLVNVDRIHDYSSGSMAISYNGGRIAKIQSTDTKAVSNNFTLDIQYDANNQIEFVDMTVGQQIFQFQFNYIPEGISTVDKYIWSENTWLHKAQFEFKYLSNRLKKRTLFHLYGDYPEPQSYEVYNYFADGQLKNYVRSFAGSHQYTTYQVQYDQLDRLLGTVKEHYHPDEGIVTPKPIRDFSIEGNTMMDNILFPKELFSILALLPEVPFSTLAHELLFILSDRKVKTIVSQKGVWQYRFDYTYPIEQDVLHYRTRPSTLYPNPTTDYLQLEGFDLNHSIEIFNSLGQSVFLISNSDAIININTLPSGKYWLRATQVDGKAGIWGFSKI